MKRLFSVMVAAALFLGAFAAHADVPRSETKRYVAVTGELLHYCNEDIGDGVELGGPCFWLDGTETAVHVTIADDNFDQVGGIVTFNDASGAAIGGLETFCSSYDMVVPPGAAEMSVIVEDVLSPTALGCANVSAGTTGSVTVDFS